jgi:ABC-type transport system involved in multi-copper enzyme maturation permease subunit
MLGPVFRSELITTARRKRYYVARFVYGLVLLLALGNQYGTGDWTSTVTINQTPQSIEELSRFARSMFGALAWAQGLALVCLIPALMAGTIADETQRRTIQYLLATPLSSTAIVGEKLAARLVHVAVIVLMGVPVVCLLALLGGLDPVEVSYIYGGTTCLVFFLSGLSLLVSVLARRPRDAILITYMLVFAWLFLPLPLGSLVHDVGWPWHLAWMAPINDVMLMMNPLHVWEMMTIRNYYYMAVSTGSASALWAPGLVSGMGIDVLATFAWMAVLQILCGSLFLVLAILALPPLRAVEGPRVKKQEPGRFRFLAPVASALRTVPKRPPCDDADPMLWKERYAVGGGLTWLRSRPVVMVLGVLLGCYLFDAAMPAFRELLGWSWYSGGGGWVDGRLGLNGALRESSTLLFILLILSIASAAAVTMTLEREQDTWTSLSGTLLTGGEVIAAKIKGAVWSSWRLVLALLVSWAVGLLAGAIHPVGVLMAVLGLFIYCGFTAALGVFISFRARNSTRALFATIFWLLVFNGGYLVVLPGPVRESELASAFVMPYIEWLTLVSYGDVQSLSAGTPFKVPGFWQSHGIESLAAYLTSLFVYAMGALILAGALIDHLDRALRPARSGGPPAIGDPRHLSGPWQTGQLDETRKKKHSTEKKPFAFPS